MNSTKVFIWQRSSDLNDTHAGMYAWDVSEDPDDPYFELEMALGAYGEKCRVKANITVPGRPGELETFFKKSKTPWVQTYYRCASDTVEFTRFAVLPTRCDREVQCCLMLQWLADRTQSDLGLRIKDTLTAWQLYPGTAANFLRPEWRELDSAPFEKVQDAAAI